MSLDPLAPKSTHGTPPSLAKLHASMHVKGRDMVIRKTEKMALEKLSCPQSLRTRTSAARFYVDRAPHKPFELPCASRLLQQQLLLINDQVLKYPVISIEENGGHKS